MKMTNSNLDNIAFKRQYLVTQAKEELSVGKREREINDLGTKSIYYKEDQVPLKEPEFKKILNIL